MAATGGEAPRVSGYGLPPKIRFEVIGEAWQLFTQQMATWIMAIVLFLVIMLVPGLVMVFGVMGSLAAALASGNRDGGPVFGLGMVLSLLVGSLLIAVVSVVMMGGMYRMAIKQVRGEPIQLSDLWSAVDVFWKLVGAGLLIGLSMAAASFLCYLPAYIVGGLLMLTLPLIVDQKLGVIEAMTRSWNALKHEWLMAAVLYFVLTFVSSLGAVVVIGIVFSYPLLFLGSALVYRDFILGGGGPPPGSPYPVGVTPGGYPPASYAATAPPTELR